MQFNAPPGALSMQKRPAPVACWDPIEEPELEPMAPDFGAGLLCAAASEMPAINAATAVRVVYVFIIRLLGG